MALLVLVNDVTFNGALQRSGKIIDSEQLDVDAMRSIGAILLSLDPLTAELAHQFTDLRAKGGNSVIDPSLLSHRGVALAGAMGEGLGLERYRTQADWHVNALTGNDANDGSEDHPLRTCKEWQRRVGRGTLLSPIGGTLRITRHTDMADDDEITLSNRFSAGNYENIGVTTTLLSGTLTAFTAADPATNTRASVQAVGFAAAHVDHWIRITGGPGAGSACQIARCPAPGTLVLADHWVHEGWEGDGFMEPGDPPAIGSTFEIFSVPRAKVNQCDFEILQDGFETPFGAVIAYADMVEGTITPAIANRGKFPSSGAFVFCKLDLLIGGPFGTGGANASIVKNNFVTQGGADVNCLFTLFHPRVDAEFPGGIEARGGGTNCNAVNCTFDGDLSGYCDARAATHARINFYGSTGFHDVFHGPFAILQSNIHFQPFGFYGEYGHVPFWGNGAADIFMGLGGANSLVVESFTDDGTAIPILPTYVSGSGPGGANVTLGSNQGDGYMKGHCVIPGVSPAPGVLTPDIDTAWAKFAVTAVAGTDNGFETSRYNVVFGPDTFEFTRAVASNTAEGNSTVFTSIRFVP